MSIAANKLDKFANVVYQKQNTTSSELSPFVMRYQQANTHETNGGLRISMRLVRDTMAVGGLRLVLSPSVLASVLLLP